MDGEPPHKRIKGDLEENHEDSPSRRSISPPLRSKTTSTPPSTTVVPVHQAMPQQHKRLVPSPIQLNRITDLPTSSNVDTVSLREILGDPLISECWIFNYLFDVDFVMSQFDDDVRDSIQVKIIHGSWKKEDSNRIRIEAAMQPYKNLQAIIAHMPEPFGTHHSKMIVLFRHDDLAQVNILTGNMVAGDWRMSQAIWRSPLLPLLDKPAPIQPLGSWTPPSDPLGSGPRFKFDLLSYLRGYDRLGSLVEKLNLYDFQDVRGALIASLPRKQANTSKTLATLWGLPGLARVLRSIPDSRNSVKASGVSDTSTPSRSVDSGPPQILIQISSVASIGEKWLREYLFPRMGRLSSTSSSQSLSASPQFSIVFPTADEIRRSTDGYGCGGSIHMRTQSSTQRKQLDFIRPMLCHWAGDERPSDQPIREASRRRAAPHIKTYIRFSDSSMTRIDWAMMTSANLSNQAWGSSLKDGQIRVCSYEIGIVVWPGLWDDEEAGIKAEMVPTFKQDMPDGHDTDAPETIKVGWRMPYDLPLVPYGEGEMPWCASEPNAELDWMGRSWPGFGAG